MSRPTNPAYSNDCSDLTSFPVVQQEGSETVVINTTEGYGDDGGSTPTGTGAGFWHTNGKDILDSEGSVIKIAGVNWFGMEGGNYTPHGTWQRRFTVMLDEIKALGFNTLRLPFSNKCFDAGVTPQGFDTALNPEWVGKTPLQILDTIVDYCEDIGLRIILDRHTIWAGSDFDIWPLWYNDYCSEQEWIDDWVMLAGRYAGRSIVVGADLHNEPHNEFDLTATWGDGNNATDWKAAATRCGNAIHAVNPDWLIIIEGIQSYGGEFYWWGGNLKGVASAPVTLNTPNKVVYSAHDYPSTVNWQEWFGDPSYPDNLPDIWDNFWGFIVNDNIAPVLIGEFGTYYATTSDQQWLNALVSYMDTKNISWTFWCMNPNSGDTGGIWLDDWVTVHQAKMQALTPGLFPFGGGGGGGGTASCLQMNLTSTANEVGVRVEQPIPKYRRFGFRLKIPTSTNINASSAIVRAWSGDYQESLFDVRTEIFPGNSNKFYLYLCDISNYYYYHVYPEGLAKGVWHDIEFIINDSCILCFVNGQYQGHYERHKDPSGNWVYMSFADKSFGTLHFGQFYSKGISGAIYFDDIWLDPNHVTAKPVNNQEAVLRTVENWLNWYVYPDGAVVRPYPEGYKDTTYSNVWSDVVSEGIAYGECLAARFDYKEKFDLISNYHWNVLRRVHFGQSEAPNLMGWLYRHDTGQMLDNNLATDADIDSIKGHIWAHKRWGSSGAINYLARALMMADDIRNYCTSNAITDGKRFMWSDRFKAEINPSYFDWQAFELLKTYDSANSAFWENMAKGCYEVVRKATDNVAPLATTAGLPPDWCNWDYGQNTVVEKAGRVTHYKYDAFRTVPRIYWDYKLNGDAEALAQLSGNYKTFMSNYWTTNGTLATEFDHLGTALGTYESTMFILTAYLAITANDENNAVGLEMWNQKLNPTLTYYEDDGGAIWKNNANVTTFNSSYFQNSWCNFLYATKFDLWNDDFSGGSQNFASRRAVIKGNDPSATPFNGFRRCKLTGKENPLPENDWRYRREIVIKADKVNGALTDFPVYIYIQDDYIKYPQYGGRVESVHGYDIIFSTDSLGQNVLDHEIEHFNGITGDLKCWVRVPNISADTDTTIYMIYGNPQIQASLEKKQTTWNPNFKAVWHLKDEGSAILDSTVSQYHGVAYDGYGVPVSLATTGLIAGGQNFDGSNDFIDVADNADFTSSNFTVSCLFMARTLPSVKGEIAGLVAKKHTDVPWNSWRLEIGTDDKPNFLWVDSSGAEATTKLDQTITASTWYHLVARKSGTEITLFLNAVEGTPGVASGTVYDSADPLRIGADWFGGGRLDGKIDEVKFSNTGRSDGWIQAEYENLINPTTFYLIGEEQTLEGQALYEDRNCIITGQGITPTSKATSGYVEGVNPITWQHTIEDETDQILVVTFKGRDGNVSSLEVTGVTCGGQALTKAVAQETTISEYHRAEIWYLVNPPTGVNTIAVTTQSEVRFAVASSILLSGVDQNNPVNVTANSRGTSSLSQLSLTTTRNNCKVVDAVYAGVPQDMICGQVEQYQHRLDLELNRAGMSTKVATNQGVTTMSWNFISSGYFVHVATAFNSAGTTTDNFNASRGCFINGVITSHDTGKLAGLTYRIIDTMKLNKDNVKSQPNDIYLERVIDCLYNNFNLTHIGTSLPMETTASFQAEGVTMPAPRTIEAITQKWADEIHERGLGVLWRGTFCGIEGIYDFDWKVGGNRYPAGTYQDLFGATFTDNFNRTDIGTDWDTYYDTTDWVIENGTLKSGQPTGGWAGLALTKNVYTDFDMTARVRFAGQNTQVVFRSNETAGYGLQLRTDSGGTIRLERWGLANLGEIVRTLTLNSWYRVRILCAGDSIKCKVWPDGTGEPGAWDIEVTDSTYGSGKVGFSSESEYQYYDDISVTASANTDTWLGKLYRYIVDHPNYFQNGDLWAPLPERTEDIFNDDTSFIPHAGGIQTNYANFFIDVQRVSEKAFADIGKTGVICGMTANNWSEIGSGWLLQPVLDEAGITAFDHYGTDGANHSVEEMETDYNNTYNNRGLPMFHREWGDDWNGGVDEATRTAYLTDMYDMMATFVANGKLVGFNYWGGWYQGLGEQLLVNTGTEENPTFGLLYTGEILQEYFAGGTGTQTAFVRGCRLPGGSNSFNSYRGVKVSGYGGIVASRGCKVAGDPSFADRRYCTIKGTQAGAIRDFLKPRRKGKISFGLASEYLQSFMGYSNMPNVDKRKRVVKIHFEDELENLANFKLSGGALIEDIRTDRYIWGILDEVYNDQFTVIGSCDSDETWTDDAEVETVNQRGGDGCIKLTSVNNAASWAKTAFDAKNLASYLPNDYLFMFVYVEDITKFSTLQLQLMTTGGVFYRNLYGLQTGWNHFIIRKSEFIESQSPNWSSVTSCNLVYRSVAGTTSYVIFDEIRMCSENDYPKRIFDTGIQTIPIAWWAGNTALYEIETATTCEGARFYCDEDGVLRFENRQHYNLNQEYKSTQWGFDFDNSTDMMFPGNESDIINNVIVKLKPRRVVSTPEQIWSYGMVPSIGAGQTKEIWASYIDPCPSTEEGIIVPTANVDEDLSDYLANTQDDGEGTDKTAQISIDIERFATASKIMVTNNDASPVYLTKLRLRGTPAKESDEITITVSDEDSIEVYGKRPKGAYTIENKYMTDEAYAETLAQNIIDWYKNPRNVIVLKNRAVPQLQLGDMITVKDNQTERSFLMRITWIKTQISEAGGLSQEIHCRDVLAQETLNYFTIGTSAIEGEEVIAP